MDYPSNNRMNKIILALGFMSLMLIIACTSRIEIPDEPAATVAPETTTTISSGDASVDQIGNEISQITAEDKDLTDPELEDLDSILKDIENI